MKQAKLLKSIKNAVTLVLARTFGQYIYSMGGPGVPDMAVYHWRGQDWAFPITPLEEHERSKKQRR